MQVIAASDPAAWEAMFRINLLSKLNVFRAAIAIICPQGRGSLCAVGAQAALKAPPEMAAYAASKSVVLRLLESFAEELRAEGIRVNAVLPGTIDTLQNGAAMPGADPFAWVRPEAIGRIITFLLWDAASGVTGALLPATAWGECAIMFRLACRAWPPRLSAAGFSREVQYRGLHQRHVLGQPAWACLAGGGASGGPGLGCSCAAGRVGHMIEAQFLPVSRRSLKGTAAFHQLRL